MKTRIKNAKAPSSKKSSKTRISSPPKNSPRPVEASSTRKPRILWANAYCLLDTSSGASISVRQILHQLQRNGYDVNILGATNFDSPRGAGAIKDHLGSSNRSDGDLIKIQDGPLTHHLVKTKSTIRDDMTIVETSKLYGAYTAFLHAAKPDLVFFYGGQVSDFMIPHEARFRGIPSAAYLVNANYQGSRWCRDVDLIITDTHATAKFYAEHEGFEPKPVGKFIDLGKVIAKEHQRKHATLINPSWSKGAGIVAMLAILLEDKRPDITFEVVESRGSWEEVVRNVSREVWGKERSKLKNVLVTPNTDNISEVYERSRIVLGLSQWWESGSRVLAEALLNGIPAMVSNYGGSPEMVGDGGITVNLPLGCHQKPFTSMPQPEHLNGLVQLLERVWDDEPFYLNLMVRAMQQGNKLHRMEVSTRRLLDAFEPLIEKRAGDGDFSGAVKRLHKHGLTEVALVATLETVAPEGRARTVPAIPRRVDRRWPDETPRICVLTLNSGEPQLDACRSSLERQALPIERHEVITGLSNKEAHDTLYAFIMSHSNNFDLFVKLDADMVPRSPDFTKAVATQFVAEPDIDHLMFQVRDWLSQSLIDGLHCFSSLAIWPAVSSERLFVDPNPVIPGVRRKISPCHDLLVDHMPTPSMIQAFYFGVHRGLKITQTERAAGVDEGRRNFHLDIFRKIEAEYLRTDDYARLAALWGFVCALDDPRPHLDRKMAEVLYPEKYKLIASDPGQARDIVLDRLRSVLHSLSPAESPAGAGQIKSGASK